MSIPSPRVIDPLVRSCSAAPTSKEGGDDAPGRLSSAATCCAPTVGERGTPHPNRRGKIYAASIGSDLGPGPPRPDHAECLGNVRGPLLFANSAVNDGGALVVNWDEAGLGQQQVNYTLSADATAIYACINGGGNHPKATNKQTVAGQVNNGATFTPENVA
jgi:hypothetical protein